MNAQLIARSGLCVFLFCVAPPWAGGVENGPPTPLAQAHSHNDYEHEHPLLDALQHGFCSVEADVWLVEGELLVAHDRDKVQPGRTLESLYLKPLRERVVANEGRVYRDGPPFTLLIDFKSEADSTYDALKGVLATHKNILTHFENGRVQTNAITVIISGNRPVEKMKSEDVRLAAIDGRLSDMENLPPIDLMPLISDNWSNVFQWRGEGEFSETELDQLTKLVLAAHEAGRRVRFWGSPDRERSWAVQKKAGVDLINTDKLGELAAFLLEPVSDSN
jgi:glycerophosphoryl diester phosphodiesterase